MVLKDLGLQRNEAAQDRVTYRELEWSKAENIPLLLDASGQVEILVNNAGAIPGGDLQRIDEQKWRDAWELKVFGYINLSRAVYKIMMQKKSGVIVNITGLVPILFSRLKNELPRRRRRV